MPETNNLIKLPSVTDEMALIRTKLANERTFLAYLRTFIGSFAAGTGFIKFTGDLFFVRVGFVLTAISPVILIFGLIRFIRVRHLIALPLLERISGVSGETGSARSGEKPDESR